MLEKRQSCLLGGQSSRQEHPLFSMVCTVTTTITTAAAASVFAAALSPSPPPPSVTHTAAADAAASLAAHVLPPVVAARVVVNAEAKRVERAGASEPGEGRGAPSAPLVSSSRRGARR